MERSTAPALPAPAPAHILAVAGRPALCGGQGPWPSRRWPWRHAQVAVTTRSPSRANPGGVGQRPERKSRAVPLGGPQSARRGLGQTLDEPGIQSRGHDRARVTPEVVRHRRPRHRLSGARPPILRPPPAAHPPPVWHQPHSGFFGTPRQGCGIDGWAGGAGCGTEVRFCDAVCNPSTYPSAAPPGFGVVEF